jgi:hypothetical protein
MLAALSLAFATLPLAMTLGNLGAYRTPRRASGRPVLSVLVPARNEARNIAETVRCILASEDVELELIVLDDHSTDATRAILAAIPDPRLRVASAPPLPAGWSGKQHACAELATFARQDLMVFLDADVRLAPDALVRVAHVMATPGIGLASGFPRQATRSWAEHLLLPLIHFLLLGFLPMWLMRRFVAPSLGAGCGQLMAVHRQAYARAGGHAAIRGSRHDGLTLPRAFRRAGIMSTLFDASRLASCRMYLNATEVWEGLTKNATEGMATPVALPAWTIILGVGQVLPLPLLLLDPGALAAAALACGYATRLLLAWRFRASLLGVVLHPFGVTALLVVQWAALLRAARGRPSTWRGRAYPAA